MKHPLKHRRLSEKEIRALLSTQEKCDVPVTAFCKTHKIHKGTYYNWRSKYGILNGNAAQFIPVQLGQPDSLPALFGEIELPSKVIVRLYQRVDAGWVKSLLS